MGLIPKVDTPAPVFIHVDMDDLWAIGECYGYPVSPADAHRVSESAMLRFLALFEEAGVRATFFVVGRDLENPGYLDNMKQAVARGHAVANHSWSHSLRFRDLTLDEMNAEVTRAHDIITDKLGVSPTGFRAPGYGWSARLLDSLEGMGYRYDASLMPSPFGGVFRWMDKRLQKKPVEKTQYPLMRDALNSLAPSLSASGRLVEVPSATSPLLRLPFQAGVCMRLGYGYYRACLQPFLWNRALPFVFLFHAVDLADLSGVDLDLVRDSSFFNTPIENRLTLARRFLQKIQEHRPVLTTEEWLQGGDQAVSTEIRLEGHNPLAGG